MKTRTRHWSERLRASMWFLPALLVVGSVALSSLTLRLDERYGERLADAWFLFTGGPQGAAAVLTAIASSMIGVTGVIFSITVVALSLASQQFGPRLLRGFIRDRSNQVVLGVFIGTFTFSLLALRAVDSPQEQNPVPEITVNVAIGLALACLGLLIYFVHHVATTIQADTIVAQVSRDLHATIDELYPERLGSEPPPEPPGLPPAFDAEAVAVRAGRTGYVQAIDPESLFARVQRHDVVLRLAVRPGDFVVEGDVVAWAWREGGTDEAAGRAVEEAILVGRQRTGEQDVEFLLAQLVEVAVRALSPGINDPFTASRCVDRIAAALCHLAQRRIPSPVRVDDAGRARVVARVMTWESAVDMAFDQVRQHAARNVAVSIRILEAAGRVADCLPPRDPRRRPLARQVRQVERGAAEAGFDPDDLADVRQRLDALRARGVA
ncbi:MAG TPA: DUF2254 domain-containing protein [Candidatus Thermoplasmatota archaeon]|nr:DUF2254 domain-containing protein [Candidatus Thermoplasmatota archaeon]